MNLPSTFVATIHNSFGERGRLFLRALPGLLDEAVQRWGLSDVQVAAELSYNFVAFARRDAEEVVLKLGVPDAELTSEIRSLRHFAGRATVRLLESDSGRGMLLLERIRPGDVLAALSDDDEATQIAARVMLALRRPVPDVPGLIQLSRWFGRLDTLLAMPGEGCRPLERSLVQAAASVAHELLTENSQVMLIHGDLHHFNILRSEQRGWLAIDPKGVTGPAGYEVGPLLVNPWVVRGVPGDLARRTSRRIAILADALGLEKERIRRWGFAYAVLSAAWSVEGGEDWTPAVACARTLSNSVD